MAKRKTLAKRGRKNRKTRKRHLPIKMKGGTKYKSLIPQSQLMLPKYKRSEEDVYIQYDLTHYYETIIGNINFIFKFLKINEDYCIIEPVIKDFNGSDLQHQLNKYFENYPTGTINYKIFTHQDYIPPPRESYWGWGTGLYEKKIYKTYNFWRFMIEKGAILSRDQVQDARKRFANPPKNPHRYGFTSSYQRIGNDD